jgi:hypothetical protein
MWSDLKKWDTKITSWDTLKAFGNSRTAKLLAFLPLLSLIIVNINVVADYLPKSALDLSSGAPVVDNSGALVGLLHEPKAWVANAIRSLATLYLGLLIFSFGQLGFSLFCPRQIKRFEDESEFAIEQKSAWWGCYFTDDHVLNMIRLHEEPGFFHRDEIETMRLYYRATAKSNIVARHTVCLFYSLGTILISYSVIERSIVAGWAALQIIYDPWHGLMRFVSAVQNY